jgi:phosphosulfolactate phosphohydrolase-like enzyme
VRYCAQLDRCKVVPVLMDGQLIALRREHE